MTTRFNLQNIEERYEGICRYIEECRGGKNPQKEEAFFKDREKLKWMEWLVLGATQQRLKAVEFDYPTLAVESEGPDFFTYVDEKKSNEQKIEVTQALKPGYKQKLEHKTDAIKNRYPDKLFIYELARPLKSPFQSLRECILKKAKKKYASSTILMVYYNVSDSDRTYHLSFSEHILIENKNSPFLQVEKFKRVLILSADFEHLIELYPHPRLISSSKPPFLN